MAAEWLANGLTVATYESSVVCAKAGAIRRAQMRVWVCVESLCSGLCAGERTCMHDDINSQARRAWHPVPAVASC